MLNITRNFHCSSVQWKIVPSHLKSKSKSSHEWLTRQLNDPYVKAAREMDFRARSAFKLLEIDDKLKILKPGLFVVEAGAAPGAWTQVIVNRINSNGKDSKKPIGKVIGIDLLPVAPLPGAIFLQCCDFTSPETHKQIECLLSGNSQQEKHSEVQLQQQISSSEPEETQSQKYIDLVLSDMAPNASGTSSIDHERIINLSKYVLKFALDFSKVGSSYLTKVWDGSDLKLFENLLSEYYKNVKRIKPKASRTDSSEIYLFAQSLKDAKNINNKS